MSDIFFSYDVCFRDVVRCFSAFKGPFGPACSVSEGKGAKP